VESVIVRELPNSMCVFLEMSCSCSSRILSVRVEEGEYGKQIAFYSVDADAVCAKLIA
jgi:hypothetical protein